jgi:2-keto-myo-inositol isomerase
MFLGFNQATTLKNSTTLNDLELAEKYGFDFMEFQMTPLYSYLENHTVAELKSFFDESRLKPYALNALEYFNLKTPREFKDVEKEFIRMCEIATSIGCGIIILVPSRINRKLTAREIREDSVNCIKRLLEIIYARQYNVKLSYEFIGFSDFSVNNFSSCYEIVEELNDERVGMTIDCSHFYASGSKISDLRNANGKKIFAFHVNGSKDKPLNELTDADRIWPGDGVMPLDEILPVLKGIGFNGAASIELFNPDYWKLGAEEVFKISKEKLTDVISRYY